MNRGYIKLFRKIEDCEVFNEPVNRFRAWIDLLLMVNHKEKTVTIGKSTNIHVRRGQKWTSMEKLARRWDWSYKTVKGYLKMLESEGMIYLESTNKGVLITVVNYGKYQDFDGKSAEQIPEQNTEQIPEQRENKMPNRMPNKFHTNNNDKNDIKNDFKNENKNVKKPAAHFDSCGVVYEE